MSAGGLVVWATQMSGLLSEANGQAGDAEKLWEPWNETEHLEVMPTSVMVGCYTELSQNARSPTTIRR